MGVAKYESSGKWSAPAVEIPGWGVGKLTFTGKLAAVFQPNYKEIGEWLSEQLAKEVVVDLAFDASIALVGVRRSWRPGTRWPTPRQRATRR